MTNRQDQLAQAAAALQQATTSGEPIAPLRETIDNLTLGEAYQIQALQEAALVAAGEEIVGRKVGLTSFAMQRQLGVDEPDFGFFTAKQLYRAGEAVDVTQLISPKVEPEFAFELGADLTGKVTRDEAAAAIAATYMAIEIIDSRIADWNIKLVDTVADNASLAAVVISNEPLNVAIDDLPAVACDLIVDGEVAGSGHGRDVLGDPVAALAWLATTFSDQGVALRKGDLVLPGSFCAAAAVAADMKVTADFGELGTLDVSFTGAGK